MVDIEGFSFLFGREQYFAHATEISKQELDLKVCLSEDENEQIYNRYKYKDPHLPPKYPWLDNPLQIFYQHATFLDILNALKVDPLTDPQIVKNLIVFALKNDPPAETSNSAPDNRKSLLENYLTAITNKQIPSDDKGLLETVRDYPILLTEKNILIRFLDIFSIARYGAKQKREIAIHNLNMYFLPKLKQPYPVQIRIPMELLKKLAKHLSDKIKPLIDVEGAWRDWIKNSTDWKNKYNEIKLDFDPRLRKLDSETIRKILVKPAEYARKLLMEHINITSRETLHKLSKK